MADLTVKRAELIELRDDLSDVMPGGKRTPVQFNPETLKISYSNQVQSQNNASSQPATPPRGAANQSQPARQFIGQGTTKLSLQLWFDVTAATDAPFMVDDVRRLTTAVLYFMKPRDPQGGNNSASQRVPPGVRFAWGSFLFDGMVESLEESVEFFSPEGKALRASVALGLVQQDMWVSAFSGGGGVDRGRGPGTQPLKSAVSGQSLQQLAGSGGRSPDSGVGSFGGGIGVGAVLRGLSGTSGSARSWQNIAVANGIENPRALRPGQLIDLSAMRARIVTE